MTNDTSRLSASGITEPIEPAAVGPRPTVRARSAVSGSPTSTPESTRVYGVVRDSRGDVGIDFVVKPMQEGDIAFAMDELRALIKQQYPDHRVIEFSGRSGRLRLWREEVRFAIWQAVASVKHRIGIHTMVQMEVWDGASVEPDGWTCWLCPRWTP